MSSAAISSTFLLTLLLSVGLFFFIKASVKDRTERVTLLTQQEEDVLLPQLQQYFDQRAYRVIAADSIHNQVTFEGFVRPSLFLAIFLTLLAAVGTLCLSLVLSVVFPHTYGIWLGLVLLSPFAGVFYWQNAGRLEQVSLKWETVTGETSPPQCLITVTAHRDELIELQRILHLTQLEVEST